MHLVVKPKDVYGRPMFYPVNNQAKILAQIAGSKTLTPAVLKLAKDLGATLETAVAPPLEF
jgi:hypothetical protein